MGVIRHEDNKSTTEARFHSRFSAIVSKVNPGNGQFHSTRRQTPGVRTVKGGTCWGLVSIQEGTVAVWPVTSSSPLLVRELA